MLQYIVLAACLILLGWIVLRHMIALDEGFLPFQASRINCPTRNMSYDLRGEAAYPRRVITPFLYSTIGPEDPSQCVFRKPLEI